MLIGYIRVSKSDGSQSLDLQRDALLAAGVDPKAIYEDYSSGANENRPGFVSCIKALRSGDTLVVWKLDRLGRNLRHLINLVEGLGERDISLKVLTGHGAQIDTTTPAGRMVFGIFACLAEFERDLNRERTMAGLAAASARGRKGGRPYKLTDRQIEIAAAALKQGTATIRELAQEFKVTNASLYRYLDGSGNIRRQARATKKPKDR